MSDTPSNISHNASANKPHKARKRFGQNFLTDPSIISRIIQAIQPLPDDLVVEIGPGQGALTIPLLKTLHTLHAIELDRDLIPILQRNAQNPALHIHQQDALRFDVSQFLTTYAQSTDRIRIVGNLPYNISTPLIFHLISHHQCLRDMHFMLQKEVVNRLAADVGGKNYGRLSIMVQYHCQVEKLFLVPASAFSPAPKVESAIVRLTPHATLPYVAQDYALFAKIVTQAFGQRRKTLTNSLKGLVSREHLEQAGISPKARAETLSVQQFVELANRLGA